ncbi:HK97 family phage prohead protease [Ruminiclostridium cellulolyticum]|uniref:Phage prohead protease, HK97 family n=1 Tax=Ruminiclostridium cellulolyticum (strain ATCC 35319 / DSM 5812 / JCM 6584 / H10) TaxID=394503 RepID=B8I8S0_RUMCH|nr:HK97 family phage prohead protease [Ruminiclostridium cellulolyticum]ACL77252.1 phage prohead protease, HK97 family [Ruminiclostridium cellulolyticum H10]
METREFRKIDQYEIRQITDDNSVEITGYIAKFDSPTELWEGYWEQIDRNAFKDTLSDGHNIFLLYHHDWSKPLASTKTGTLLLEIDNIGLRFNATINSNLTYGKDAIELIRQRLIEGCSFGFYCKEEDVHYNSVDNTVIRTLLKVELYEGSILCIPQYEDTSVDVFARAREIVTEEKLKIQQEKELSELKTDLELLKIGNELL